MTAKQTILHVEPKARLDYYESLRNSGKPCWFIREGWQGPALSDICSTPRAAWTNALDSLRRSFAYQGKKPKKGVAA